jgi:hypothetical protein
MNATRSLDPCQNIKILYVKDEIKETYNRRPFHPLLLNFMWKRTLNLTLDPLIHHTHLTG